MGRGDGSSGKQEGDTAGGLLGRGWKWGISGLLLAIGLALYLFPRPMVADGVRGLSAFAEGRIQRRAARAVEDGGPCVVVAVAYSRSSVDALASERMKGWEEVCGAYEGGSSKPVVIHISHKDGGVRIDADAARDAGLQLSPEDIKTAQDRAWEELGIEHYEAVAWLALNGVLGEDVDPPWYMATRDRPLRSFLRQMDFVLVLAFLVFLVVFAMARPGTGSGQWFDGTERASGSRSFEPFSGGGSSGTGSGGGFGGFVDDDE